MKTLKKIVSICAMLAIVFGALTLTGCGKKEEKIEKAAIVGRWKLESSEEYNIYYVFNEDGTGAYEMNNGKIKFKYEDKGDKISIQFDGNEFSSDIEYKIEGDILTIKDSQGDGTRYKRQ